jgi:hypothetical protein
MLLPISPVSDLDIPSITPVSSSAAASVFVLDDIPDFPRQDKPGIASLFQRKIALCSQLCPFGRISETSMEAKTAQLRDLLRFVNTPPPGYSFTDAQIDSLYDMVESNIVHHVLPFDRRLAQQDDLPPLNDPTWPHLALIYQILTKLQHMQPKSPRLLQLARRLLPVCESPDPLERSAISSFYQQMVRSSTNARPKLLALFLPALTETRYLGEQSAFFVATILPVLWFLFAETEFPVTDAMKLFRGFILPLLIHPLFAVFQLPVVNMMEFLMDTDSSIAIDIVRFLLNKWPITSPAKQVLFFNYFTRALRRVPVKPVEAIAPQISRVMTQISSSASEKVASALVEVWLLPDGERLISIHGRALIPVMVPAIAQIALTHWAPLIRQNAKTALAAFRRREGKKVQEVLDDAAGTENPPQLAKWVAVIKSAYREDNSIVVKTVFAQLGNLFAPKPAQQDALVPLQRGKAISGRPMIVKPRLGSTGWL